MFFYIRILCLGITCAIFTYSQPSLAQVSKIQQRAAADNKIHTWAKSIGDLRATRGALRGTESFSCSRAFNHSWRTYCFTRQLPYAGQTYTVLIAVPTRWYRQAKRQDTITLRLVPPCAGPQMPMWVAQRYVRRLKKC